MFDIILHFPFRFDRKTEAVYLENCYIIIYREFFFIKQQCRAPSRLKFEMKLCLLEEMKIKWFNLTLSNMPLCFNTTCKKLSFWAKGSVDYTISTYLASYSSTSVHTFCWFIHATLLYGRHVGLHTKLYKFGSSNFPDNTRMNHRTDLNPSKVVYISIIFLILASVIHSLNGYDFHFWWHDTFIIV